MSDLDLSLNNFGVESIYYLLRKKNNKIKKENELLNSQNLLNQNNFGNQKKI